MRHLLQNYILDGPLTYKRSPCPKIRCSLSTSDDRPENWKLGSGLFRVVNKRSCRKLWVADDTVGMPLCLLSTAELDKARIRVAGFPAHVPTPGRSLRSLPESPARAPELPEHEEAHSQLLHVSKNQ